MSYNTAYGLSERFSSPPDCHKVGSLDPGGYYLSSFIEQAKENKAPFLSRCPRQTLAAARLYTHAMYRAEKPYRIVGDNPMKSKVPRFKEYATTNDEHVCDCDRRKCTCPVDGQPKESICQANVRRKLYKGHVPFSALCQGLSMPSRHHRGFLVTPDGKCEPIHSPEVDDASPPFYDKRVNEFTAFYRGCKWSHWTLKRGGPKPGLTPGPADYQHEHVPTLYELCIEEFRFQKRHNSRQLRYIEMVQLREILQGGPGPAHYDPKFPKCDAISYHGTKADRFPPNLVEGPGPADYYIDGPRPEDEMCNCNERKLPIVNHGTFGTAKRFKYSNSDSPGPADYTTCVNKMTKGDKCLLLAFESSAPRFKPDTFYESDDEDEDMDCKRGPLEEECPNHTWVFKSKTKRFKPITKRMDWASPADLLLPKKKYTKRSLEFQWMSPFNSSEGRFRPWHDWMPVQGAQVTPGPALYELDVKPSCASHGVQMPRSRRFPRVKYNGPSPNAYNVDRGIETVCLTFNKRLQNNQPKLKSFRWKPLMVEPRSIRSREKALIAKSIHDLDADMDFKEPEEPVITKEKRKSTHVQRTRIPEEKLLLKYFLYDHQIPKNI